MYDYDSQFNAAFNRAAAEYENQTPEDVYSQDDEDSVNLTEEEWEDLYGNDTEPDWDSENENW